MSEHTKTPLQIDPGNPMLVCDAEYLAYADTEYAEDRAGCIGRAAHIVRCVNAHDELVSLVRELSEYVPDGDRYSVLRDAVNDALKLAKGEGT